MAITDYKIKEEDFSAKDITSLSDRPSADGMSAVALKERFDAGAKLVIAPKINALIDALVGLAGATNIGVTSIDGVAGYNVQSVLIAIKELLDTKKDIDISDNELALKFDTADAQGLVQDVQVDLTTGIITITKYDGTITTFDTALEKVALNVRLDGQQFVLTLVDGTEQRVDLSAFLTETEVTNSETVNLSIENNVIVARIAPKSIALIHLADEVTAYLTEKETNASASAYNASVSEKNALESSNNANTSYQNALTCQQTACNCATNAKTSEDNAKNSADRAEEAADKAEDEADRAEEAANRAEAIAGGDFLERTIYDTQSRETDIFQYVDDAVANIVVDVTSSVPMYFSINENGGLRITYDDGE